MPTKKICPAGHTFYKSSDCPSCPICEASRKPADQFLGRLSAPARRALETEGILTVTKLATFSEKEILKLHGMGKASLPTLRAILLENGLQFK